MPDGTVTLLRKVSELSNELKKSQTELRQAHATLEAIRKGEVDGILGPGDLLHVVPQSDLNMLLDEAERLAAAILKNVGAAIVTIDGQGVIRHLNPAAERLFGYSAVEAVGHDRSLLLFEQNDLYILEMAIYSCRRQVVGNDVEVQAKRKDGSGFPANVYVAELALGDKHWFIASVTDVTEIKRSREELETLVEERTTELKRANEEAQQASRVKDEFLSNMSHELRTPMNSVLGYLGLALANESLPTSLQKDLGVAQRAAQTLLTIINDILDVQKINSGQFQLENRPFHLVHGIEDILQEFGPMADEKGIGFDLHCSYALPSSLSGDFSRLRQILVNLVGNAVKFTRKGWVKVRVRPAAEGKDMVHFTVEDTGIGIPKDRLESLFIPFTQIDGARNRTHGGTGLGLSIVKKIVELMGGKAWAESSLGIGSAFHFTARLPVADNTTDDGGSSALFADAPRRVPSRAFNVLLAEDVWENATLVKRSLRGSGHAVAWVRNGQEAVSAYLRGDFDVILMDVHMPEMDGHSATRKIREIEAEQGGRIPIIALTASVLSQEQERGDEAGMDAHVGKPIDFTQLLSEMERLVPKERGRLKTEERDSGRERRAAGLPMIEGVDVETGLSRYCEDEELYYKQLVGFPEKFGAAGEGSLEAFEADDIDSAIQIVHSVKGVAGNLSIDGVYAAAQSLETALRKEPENAKKMIGPFKKALEEVAPRLAAIKREESQKREITPQEEPRIAALIERLRAVYAKNERDGEALRELRSYLRDDPIFERVEQCVDGFRFSDAVSALEALAQSRTSG